MFFLVRFDTYGLKLVLRIRCLKLCFIALVVVNYSLYGLYWVVHLMLVLKSFVAHHSYRLSLVVLNHRLEWYGCGTAFPLEFFYPFDLLDIFS